MKKSIRSKVSGLALSSLSLLLLAACGSGGSAAGGEAKSGGVSVKINSAEVIIPDGEAAGRDEQFVAYNITLKNDSKGTVDFTASGINLVDEEGEAASSEYVYDSNQEFSVLDFGNIGSGKKKTGYVVFKQDKDAEKSYSLDLSYFLKTENDYSEKSLEVPIKDVEIIDNTEAVAALAGEYINKVFFNGEHANLGGSAESEKSDGKDSKKDDAKATEFVLADNIEAGVTQFETRFRDGLGDLMWDYSPSDSEKEIFVENYIKANAKRAEVSVKLISYFPNSARLNISTKAIDVKSLNPQDLADDYLEQTTGKRYGDAKQEQDAQKRIFETLHERYAEASLASSTSEDEISMYLKDGEWEVDNSDSERNYGYQSLEESMTGELIW